MGREEIAALRAAGGALRAALRDARACAGPAGRGLLTGGSARNNSQGFFLTARFAARRSAGILAEYRAARTVGNVHFC